MTGAPCAAFRPSQARVLCASAPLPEPRALLLWPGPHHQLRPLRVSPRRAVQARQATRSTPDCKGRRTECVSVPGQRRRRSLRNKAKVGTTKIRPGLFVLSVCARKSHRKLLGGMSRSRPPLRRPQTWSKMPPRPPSCAVGLRFCSWTIADCGLCLLVQDEQLQKNKQAPAKTRKADVFGKQTHWQAPLAAARRARDRADQRGWKRRRPSGDNGLGDVVAAPDRGCGYKSITPTTAKRPMSSKRSSDEIEAKREKAKKELAEAKKELAEAAEQRQSKRPGRTRAGRGASACAVVAVDFGLQHSRVRFRAVHRCCFLGSCSPLSKGHLVVKLHCVGLQPFGEREGLLAASGNLVAPRVFADA